MTLLKTSVVLALAWFAIVNVLVSVGVSLVARRIFAREIQLHPGSLLMLRLAPTAAGLVFVATVFLPAHWLFESPGTPETFGFVLLTVAFTTVALSVRALIRGVSVTVRSASLQRSLRGRPMTSAGRDTDILEIDGLSGLTVAGIFSTTILVGASARQALSDAELDVALAHEQAHRRAWDNLKRLAIFCAPDVLGFSEAGRQLERTWNAAVECFADARAVAGDRMRAVNLASALVRVARLADRSQDRLDSIVWSPFHQKGLLEMRVRRLVDGALEPRAVSRRVASLAAALIVTTLAALWLAAVPHDIYRLTEALIRFLP